MVASILLTTYYRSGKEEMEMDSIVWSYIEAILKIVGALFVDCIDKGLSTKPFKTK